MRSSRFHLPLLVALLLTGCSGGARWITYGQGGPLEATVLDQDARMESISFGLLEGTVPLRLPSGDIIACQQVTPYQFRMERLTPASGAASEQHADVLPAGPARVWSTSIAVPDSRRAVAGDGGGWVLPADQGLLLHAAGATVGLLCTRRVGPDSLAISARRFDTATGHLLMDTVLMRQHIDASIPEVARQASVAVSPGGERIAVYARVRAYGLETTDLAIQILDSYLNPIETRKIRCRLADQNQNGLVQVTDDGTMVILSKSTGHTAEILRIPPEGGTPDRRSLLFADGGDSIELRHYTMALGHDGSLRIAATAFHGAHFAGIASGTIDFAGSAPVRLGLATDSAQESPASDAADGHIYALLPVEPSGLSVGLVAVYALEIPTYRDGRAGTDLEIRAIGVDTGGALSWRNDIGRSAVDGDWRNYPIDAVFGRAGLIITYSRHDSLLWRRYMPFTGQSRDERALLRLPQTHGHAAVMPGSIAWFRNGTGLTFGVGTQDLDGIDRQDRKLVHIVLEYGED